MHRVEFTIEPFVEGQPGRHVTAPVNALTAMGVHVEVGPFGSGCSVPAGRASEVVSTIVAMAVEHGASHVNIDVTDEGGDTDEGAAADEGGA
ncbi:MAG: hypothetical protein QNJ12_09650 [Ilumatobacter sp.]|uniref:hypothetical protein n=1 Tax=Ilumatobacter sp. TaxID=1967498 RepID=UPI00261C6075|nr:hypothetical protein [Ilumatobacter sp.]MDJ0769048.1 hypothetical protein [Ilumatobacter sp.]